MIQPGENNQILINSGNAYQRVTVVPADTNSGELSYVLIVQDPDMKDGEQTDGEQDMAGKLKQLSLFLYVEPLEFLSKHIGVFLSHFFTLNLLLIS